MRNLIISIAGLLLAAARVRAECVMHDCGSSSSHKDGLYGSNAGGWN
jgi:hypothetical protein